MSESNREGRERQPSPQGERKDIESRTQLVAAAYRGPIPPPEILEGFERIVPGSADRILAMAEREQAHKHAIQDIEVANETRAIGNAFRLLARGQILGFVLLLLTLIVGGYLLSKGHNVSGLAAVFASLVAIIAIYAGASWQSGKKRNRHPDATGEGE